MNTKQQQTLAKIERRVASFDEKNLFWANGLKVEILDDNEEYGYVLATVKCNDRKWYESSPTTFITIGIRGGMTFKDSDDKYLVRHIQRNY